MNDVTFPVFLDQLNNAAASLESRLADLAEDAKSLAQVLQEWNDLVHGINQEPAKQPEEG